MEGQRKNIQKRISEAFDAFGFVQADGNWHDDRGRGSSGYHYDNGIYALCFFECDGSFLITQHSLVVLDGDDDFKAIALPEGAVVVYDGRIDLNDVDYVNKLMNSISALTMPD